MKKQASLRTCKQGHQYYKSSDCPTCPVCEELKKPADDFLSKLAAPARRALMHMGIHSVKELSKYSRQQIMNLHGMGPGSLPVLKKSLKEAGLDFKPPSGKGK